MIVNNAIDYAIVKYLTAKQKEQLAEQLEINQMLPKCLRGQPTDDHWRDPVEIKLEAIRDAKYIARRKQQQKDLLAVQNQKRRIDYLEREMTEKEKLQKALSAMLEQFINEVKNQPLITVNFKNKASVGERKDQLLVIKQTMEAIRGIKELLASMEQEEIDNKDKSPLSPDNIVLLDSAKQLLARNKIKSDL